MKPNTREDRDGGPLESLRRFVGSLLDLIQVRLEILSTEIAEERFNLFRAILVTLGALLCLQVGVILAVLFFVLSVPENDRPAAIGIAAAVLLLAAAGAALWLHRWLKTRPPMFATTLSELRKDRDRLRGGK
ncbi:MAG TPA: phage holin family protein [Candidatus Eisenbacteria bacterium]|nr:phage holin family protein [Candidatus Eisenbacteria bacterium]